MEEEKVKVVVRIRPMQESEAIRGYESVVHERQSSQSTEVEVKLSSNESQYVSCNRAFSVHAKQLEFFSNSGVTDLLDAATDGYRVCAFAFGQVGAYRFERIYVFNITIRSICCI